MQKYIQTLLIIILLVISSLSYATVWTVNNYHGAADFTTLQGAIDGASSGDTLYMEGSENSYGNGIFDKQLIVIGPGYWHEENDTTQAYKYPAQVGNLVFNAGSEDTEVQGLYIYGYNNSSVSLDFVTINTDSITLLKNFIFGYVNNAYTYTNRVIYINGDHERIIIKQNWIEARIHDSNYSTNGTLYGIYFNGIPTNCVISNNFIRSYRSSTNGSYKSIYMTINSFNNLRIVNNTIWGGITTYYTEHTNNILVTGTYNHGLGDGNMNNICSGTQYPDINNNQQNVDMNTVFLDFEKYIDNGYILTPGSPALGAGVMGGDCGAFGMGAGNQPYVLSGLPAIPAIFEVAIPTTGSASLPVNIKATSHNETK